MIAINSGGIGGNSTAHSLYWSCTASTFCFRSVSISSVLRLFSWTQLLELGFFALFEVLEHHRHLDGHLLAIDVLPLLQFGDLLFDLLLLLLLLHLEALDELSVSAAAFCLASLVRSSMRTNVRCCGRRLRISMNRLSPAS